MQDPAGEIGTNSLVTYSCRPLHMNDQLESIYNSTVPIEDVALKTYREHMDDRDRWWCDMMTMHLTLKELNFLILTESWVDLWEAR